MFGKKTWLWCGMRPLLDHRNGNGGTTHDSPTVLCGAFVVQLHTKAIFLDITTPHTPIIGGRCKRGSF
jgi:hypothetical protein